MNSSSKLTEPVSGRTQGKPVPPSLFHCPMRAQGTAGLDAFSSSTLLDFCSIFAGLQNTAGDKTRY